MNVLDILLLVAAVWFAIVGYRQGFVVGILSVIGFLGRRSRRRLPAARHLGPG